ncbi:MAG TPA: DUF134 domain-containing protein [Bacteroidales bacterium]|nr:DUF134 domain-containing protein [Bacteroidales bacterium]HSA44024.1 DUF134 domain-containing protein [Bacteroidales bacterium]
MPRPKRLRKVITPPRFKGFKPYGYYGQEKEAVVMLMEELEVIRLLDYLGMTQEEAAGLMMISRPTLTRVYEQARKKVATAFAEARTLVVEGGRVYFDQDWHRCLICNSTFNDPEKSPSAPACPVCGSLHTEQFNV